MEKGGFVYITTNKNHTTLYTGVTSDLWARINEHRNKEYPGFTDKYNCIKLVFYEFFSSIDEAIMEEKRIKAGSRAKKMERINSVNPDWKDLFEEIKLW